MVRFTCSPYIDAALKQVNDEDIIFDFRETKNIDSTIMGNIAKYFVQSTIKNKGDNKPIIVYAHDDLHKIFTKIGFDRFFKFTKEEPRVNIKESEFKTSVEIKEDAKALKSYIIKGHQVLSNLQQQDPSYKEVVQIFKDK